jgi:phospholipase C
LIAAVLLAFALAGGLAGPAAAAPVTPIHHFVVLMQENHSFDNYFGTFPGANGIPANTCMPLGLARRPCVRPFRLAGGSTPDLAHDARIQRIQLAGGRMNGFVRAASLDRQSAERSVMGYYDGRDVPFYWNVADEYVLFDRFFAASPDGSVANHRLWASGIFSRLERRGIPWKFYVEDYDGRLGEETAQAVRVPLRGHRWSRHIVDLDQYYSDLERGRLPAVAYIAPAGASEHPPGRIEAGATLTRSLVTALARSSAWDSSAFLWTYDEPGGWFDHVRPPAGAGLRVPALLVSPYARRGFVDSTPLDTTSIPAFVERNWRLARRIRARSFERAFDFSRGPREPSIPPAERRPAARTGARLWVIYLGYGAALALSGILIGWVGLRRTLAVTALLVATAAPAGAQVPETIQTVPPVPGMRFSLGGAEFQADAAGRAHPPSTTQGTLTALTTDVRPGVRARFDRWYAGRRIAALNIEYRVGFRYVDLQGNRVDPRAVDSVTLAGSNGRRHVFRGPAPRWLQGNRVIPESGGTKSTAVSYAAQRALVGGSSVVHRGQQRFFPAETRNLQLRLLLFSARFEARDALLGFPIGSAVLLEYPDGRVRRQSLGPGGELTLESLPRGDYRVRVEALGISSSRPIALSGDQDVRLQVISWLDVAIVLLALASIALALLYVRRPSGRAAALTATLVMLAVAPPATAASRPDPLFAYYYIWFNAGSWNRAKIDYPLLGRYSSDDRGVMEQHVDWAKRAGIDGFIVSWKSTPVLNRRLERLIQVADAQGFKLLVIYQGLDFQREPQPASRVGADLDLFIDRFAADPAFEVFDKPVVIWSGTPKFSRAELAAVTKPRRDALRILASERNVEGYRRVAALVDGNAYYWASVNPRTYPGQAAKLTQMGDAVHARRGIWIPSAAPGFDARAVGGTSVVERYGGATLRAELDAAATSSPDAVGLISWNEFSENTHIEPSREHGSRYLRLVGDVRGARLPEVRDFDSSEPAATDVSYGVPLLGGLALFIVGGVALLTLRR